MMQRMPGEYDLAYYLKLSPELRRSMGIEFDEKKILSIARDILEILAWAHARGIVHRDVKPANIVYNNGTDGRFF